MSNEQLFGWTLPQIEEYRQVKKSALAGDLTTGGRAKNPPIDTYLAKLQEKIEGRGSGTGSGFDIHSGQAVIMQRSGSGLVESTLTTTVWNTGRGSVGSGVLVQLHREPMGHDALAFDVTGQLSKVELIDNCWNGKEDASKAWLLEWDKDEEDWVRTETQLDIYADKGTRGMGFGKTDEVDRGDIVDVAYSVESARYYALALGFYVHGRFQSGSGATADEDVPASSADTFVVKLDVGGGDDEREISINAYNPGQAKPDHDELVSVTWNDFSLHWDLATYGDGSGSGSSDITPGCGLRWAEGEEKELEVNPFDLAGNGLVPDESGCGMAIDPATICGFVNECFDGLAGCGINITEGVISVNAPEVAGNGLEATGDCSLTVKASDGIDVGAGGVSVKVGCGVWINGGNVEVANDELAGDGLSAGDDCRLDVLAGDGITVDESGVKVNTGCGLWINGGAVEVANDELAGEGLTVGSNCAIDIDLTEGTPSFFYHIKDVDLIDKSLRFTQATMKVVKTESGLVKDVIEDSTSTFEIELPICTWVKDCLESEDGEGDGSGDSSGSGDGSGDGSGGSGSGSGSGPKPPSWICQKVAECISNLPPGSIPCDTTDCGDDPGGDGSGSSSGSGDGSGSGGEGNECECTECQCCWEWYEYDEPSCEGFFTTYPCGGFWNLLGEEPCLCPAPSQPTGDGAFNHEKRCGNDCAPEYNCGT